MAKKRGKSASFEAMVKFFMQQYNIPSKKDMEKIVERLDRIESLIKMVLSDETAGRLPQMAPPTNNREKKITASDVVYDVISNHKDGIGVVEIQDITGFNKKKLRNIIFRLNHQGKIKRKSRGIYIVS